MVDVFISWSGDTGRRVALLLRDWLPDVIQEVRPWVSSEDIPKGRRWSKEISERLSDTSQGIVCVTRDSQREAWLNFEAGALAKSPDDASVRTLLVDLAPSDVTGPLADFQATSLRDRDDMFRMVESVNAVCTAPLPPDRLRRAFDSQWPALDANVTAAVAAAPPADAARSVDEMVSEILDRVRAMERDRGRSSTEGDAASGQDANALINATIRIEHFAGPNLRAIERRGDALWVRCLNIPDDVDAYVGVITRRAGRAFAGRVVVEFDDRPGDMYTAEV